MRILCLLALLVAGPAFGQALQPVTASNLKKEVKAVGADFVIVNYWATWCVPCRKEFPEFVRYDKATKYTEVRFVSVDFEDSLDVARAFLHKQGVTGTSYWVSEKPNAFIQAVSEGQKWSGSVPATFVYDKRGRLLTFWEGKVTYNQLAARLDKLR